MLQLSSSPRTGPDSRESRLSEPHVAPLMSLITGWRGEGLDVPNVDPNDGGIFAKALFLLESPGPRAVGTGFISRDNPDPSARNMTTALAGSGFTRADTILWNVVPYCVSTPGQNRNASPAQVRAAAPYTQRFIDLLMNLKVVVFCGKRAQLAERYLSVGVPTLLTYHPGAMAYNRPHCREHLHATFAAAHALIGRSASHISVPDLQMV
jgi:uracil-DNA glycosylase